MSILPWRTQQSTGTTGTGTLTLNAAATSRRSFQAAFGSSAIRVAYVLSGTSFYEMGYGDYDGGAPGTLTRVTVIASSNAGALVSLPAGTADVFPWIDPAQRSVVTGTGTITLALADLGNAVVWTGTAAQTLALPAVASVPNGVGTLVRNLGTAALTIDPNGAEFINGATTVVLSPGQSAEVLRAGTQWVSCYENARIIGEVIWGGWTALQPRCLWPNGQNVSRTAYAALFAAYGTSFGAGDGTTTFGLPDLRGRTMFGKDDMGGSAASRVTTAGSTLDGATLGAAGGSQLMQQHLHTASDSGHIHGVTDPGHTHNSKAGTSGAVGPLDGASSGSGNAYPTTSATTGISIGASVANITVANAGSGTSQNMPPALMLNAQIYAGV